MKTKMSRKLTLRWFLKRSDGVPSYSQIQGSEFKLHVRKKNHSLLMGLQRSKEKYDKISSLMYGVHPRCIQV